MQFVPKQLKQALDKKLLDKAKDKYVFPTAHRRVGRWVILRWVGVNKNTIHVVPKFIMSRIHGWVPDLKNYEGKATYYNLMWMITHGSFAVYPGSPNFITSYVGFSLSNISISCLDIGFMVLLCDFIILVIESSVCFLP